MWLLLEFPCSGLCQEGPPTPNPSLGKAPWNLLHLSSRLWTDHPGPQTGSPLSFP